jgi:hypothetical protein
MALVKGTNSYATVLEAEEYFGDRLDVSAWLSASDSQKTQSLVTASLYFNNFRWLGTAISDSQSLAFPRNITYYESILGKNVTISAVPDRIVKATFELAYHLLNNDGLLDDTGSVTDITVETINLKIRTEASKTPSTVKKYISPLLENGGSNSWWRFA